MLMIGCFSRRCSRLGRFRQPESLAAAVVVVVIIVVVVMVMMIAGRLVVRN
jgi:hypothetical protein